MEHAWEPARVSTSSQMPRKFASPARQNARSVRARQPIAQPVTRRGPKSTSGTMIVTQYVQPGPTMMGLVSAKAAPRSASPATVLISTIVSLATRISQSSIFTGASASRSARIERSLTPRIAA